VLTGVALAIERAVVSTDDGLERAQAVFSWDGGEVDQQVLRGALFACGRGKDDFAWLRITRPGDPYLLEERLDLGSGDEDVGVAHPFRDVPEDSLDVSHRSARSDLKAKHPPDSRPAADQNTQYGERTVARVGASSRRRWSGLASRVGRLG
jgi:hypothetical protein